MRMLALILIVMAATLPMAPASPQDRAKPPLEELPPPPGLPPVKAQREEPAKTVKELQKERIATLEEAADVIDDLYRNQRAPHEEVSEARLLLLEAKLDAAEKESERVTLLKKIVDVLKEDEQWADARFKASRTTTYPVLKIKARRLRAEIDLERAKAKEAKKAK
jgi:outer membrane protein TolC